MSNNRRKRRSNSIPPETGHVMAGTTRPFHFIHNGERHILPPASEALARMRGGDIIDAVDSPGDSGELRFSIKVLKMAKPTPEAWQALRDMEMQEFSDTVARWMRKTGGVSPGESVSSSE